MRELVGTDELKNARIRESDLSGARLSGVNFSNVSITDAWLFNTKISGLIGGLTINGVEVVPLRHLLFATDAWLTRMVLRVPNAYHEWAVPPDLPLDAPRDSGPGLDAVLEVRAERMARVRDYLSSAVQEDLSRVVPAPDSIGHPQGNHRVLDCFLIVLREEWWHHQYATRDLALLERS